MCEQEILVTEPIVAGKKIAVCNPWSGKIWSGTVEAVIYTTGLNANKKMMSVYADIGHYYLGFDVIEREDNYGKFFCARLREEDRKIACLDESWSGPHGVFLCGSLEQAYNWLECEFLQRALGITEWGSIASIEGITEKDIGIEQLKKLRVAYGIINSEPVDSPVFPETIFDEDVFALDPNKAVVRETVAMAFLKGHHVIPNEIWEKYSRCPAAIMGAFENNGNQIVSIDSDEILKAARVACKEYLSNFGFDLNGFILQFACLYEAPLIAHGEVPEVSIPEGLTHEEFVNAQDTKTHSVIMDATRKFLNEMNEFLSNRQVCPESEKLFLMSKGIDPEWFLQGPDAVFQDDGE